MQVKDAMRAKGQLVADNLGEIEHEDFDLARGARHIGEPFRLGTRFQPGTTVPATAVRRPATAELLPKSATAAVRTAAIADPLSSASANAANAGAELLYNPDGQHLVYSLPINTTRPRRPSGRGFEAAS